MSSCQSLATEEITDTSSKLSFRKLGGDRFYTKLFTAFRFSIGFIIYFYIYLWLYLFSYFLRQVKIDRYTCKRILVRIFLSLTPGDEGKGKRNGKGKRKREKLIFQLSTIKRIRRSKKKNIRKRENDKEIPFCF